MRTLALLVLLLVPGCAAVPPVDQKPVDPVFVGAEVPVVVREKCAVEVPAQPAWQVEAIAPGTTAFDKSKALLAENEQRRDYINQILAASKKCE